MKTESGFPHWTEIAGFNGEEETQSDGSAMQISFK